MGHGLSTEWQAEKSQAFKAKPGIIMLLKNGRTIPLLK